MKCMNKIFVFIAFIFLGVGCSVYQIDSKDTTQDFYPPKKSIDEVMYMETVDQPYEEIGIVTVTTERRQTLEDVLPKLRQEAAILGGDAITDIRTDATGSWKKMTSVSWKKIKLQKLLGNAYIRANYTARVLALK